MATAATLRELRRKHGLGEFKKTASRTSPKTAQTNRKKSAKKSRSRRTGTHSPAPRKRIRRRKTIGIGFTRKSKLSEWELVKDARSPVLQFSGGRAASSGPRRINARKPGPIDRTTRKKF